MLFPAIFKHFFPTCFEQQHLVFLILMVNFSTSMAATELKVGRNTQNWIPHTIYFMQIFVKMHQKAVNEFTRFTRAQSNTSKFWFLGYVRTRYTFPTKKVWTNRTRNATGVLFFPIFRRFLYFKKLSSSSLRSSSELNNISCLKSSKEYEKACGYIWRWIMPSVAGKHSQFAQKEEWHLKRF